MTIRKTFATIALTASTALVLSACADSGSTTDTATETATAQDTAADTTATATDAADGAGTATDTTETTTDDQADTTETSPAADQAAGDDPVFAAIDAALAEYAGGVVVSIDREDNSGGYDMDVVVGQDVFEIEVAEDGSIREEEREGDEDDEAAEAEQATVTAADAITQALEQHPDGVLDELELEEDDGQLRFEIDLDDQDRRDLAEVTIPAN